VNVPLTVGKCVCVPLLTGDMPCWTKKDSKMGWPVCVCVCVCVYVIVCMCVCQFVVMFYLVFVRRGTHTQHLHLTTCVQ